MRLSKLAAYLTVVVWMLLLAVPVLAAPDAPRISREDLRKRLGDKDLVVIDVRTGHD